MAKATLLRTVETKRWGLINENWHGSIVDVGGPYGSWKAKNLFALLNNGIYGYGLNGSEIVNPFIKIKGRIWVEWNANRQINSAVGPQTSYTTVYVICANEDYAWAGPQPVFPYTTGDVEWFYSANPVHPTLNGNNVKVLARKRIVIDPDLPIAGTGATALTGTTTRTFSMKLRIKKKLTFEDDNAIPTSGGLSRAGRLKGWNYFLLVQHGVQIPVNTAAVGNAVNMQLDTFMYFKDP